MGVTASLPPPRGEHNEARLRDDAEQLVGLDRVDRRESDGRPWRWFGKRLGPRMDQDLPDRVVGDGEHLVVLGKQRDPTLAGPPRGEVDRRSVCEFSRDSKIGGVCSELAVRRVLGDESAYDVAEADGVDHDRSDDNAPDVRARCYPRCRLSAEKVPICTQVRFLPGAYTASLS
jgi:hypothetical protein